MIVKRGRLQAGLARVRISDPYTFTGEEMLVSPGFYERHIFISEAPVVRNDLHWLTFRLSSFGRELPTEELNCTYAMKVKKFNPTENTTVTDVQDASLANVQYTGVYVKEPINAYIPLPLLCYNGGVEDQYVESREGFYPDVYPYAVPSWREVAERGGKKKVEVRPFFLCVPYPSAFSVSERGIKSLGSISQIFSISLNVIPKKIKVITENGEREYGMPRYKLSWSQLKKMSEDELKSYQYTIYEGYDRAIRVEPATFLFSDYDPLTGREYRAKIIDGDFIGIYVNWHSGDDGKWFGRRRFDNTHIDYTFGFGIYPTTIINQDIAALSATATIRIFWGGHYMLEFTPLLPPIFYFIKDGYTVPVDPCIPSKTFSIYNESFKADKKRAGIHREYFMLKELRPRVEGPIAPPNLYKAYIPQMNIQWGTKQIQPAASYNLFVIMHIRDHVCIFDYRDFLQAARDGREIAPLFAFNPVEYIYQNYGEAEARAFLRKNNGGIASSEYPPMMWLFNTVAFITIPYFEYTETAISTRPSFLVPSNNTILSHIEQDTSAIYEKVVPAGLFRQNTSSGRILALGSLSPLVLSWNEPIPWEYKTETGTYTGNPPDVEFVDLWKTGGARLPFGSYLSHAQIISGATSAGLFVGMRGYSISSPSPHYKIRWELVRLGDVIKSYLLRERKSLLDHLYDLIRGGAPKVDGDFVVAIARTSTRAQLQTVGSESEASEETIYGEISGFVPYPEIRHKIPSVPTPDGDKDGYIDYLSGRKVKIIVQPSTVLPRPPVLIGADIYRCPIVKVSPVSPYQINVVFPPPRYSQIDTAVTNVQVTLSDTIGSSSCTVSLVVDETALNQWGVFYGGRGEVTQPAELIPTALSTMQQKLPTIGGSTQPTLTEIAFPSPLLYRRMVVELGYIIEEPGAGITAALYPVFDGFVTDVQITGRRETAAGRQVEVTLRGVDIFTRLRYIAATTKEPPLDNWTAGQFALWICGKAGLSPLRVEGITGLPAGAPLSWWLGSERIVREDLLGSRGFPVQNVPENPRATISVGSSLADALERLAGESGCEVVVAPLPTILHPLFLYKEKFQFWWRNILTPQEFDLYLTPVNTFKRTLPPRSWRSALCIVPAGYYSPVPTWSLAIGFGEYTSFQTINRSGFLSYMNVFVPEAPYVHGIAEIGVQDSVWNLPTTVIVEGADLFYQPFYYVWHDPLRETVAGIFSPLYPAYFAGFQIAKYVSSPDILNDRQAKTVALRALFGGRFFPPKTMRIALGVGLPFLYPRHTVRVISSDRFFFSPPFGYSLWMIKSVTHSWEAGDTPKTVLELVVPHWFPMGVPT